MKVFDRGFTSIIDLAFGPSGKLYVVELDEASWAAVEIFGASCRGHGPYLHLIHYGAGGSARDRSRSLERALQLDFDTVILGHSGVTDRATMEGFLAETVRLQDMVREMTRARRSRDDIRAMLTMEFGWSDFMLNFGLDGIITEMQ